MAYIDTKHLGKCETCRHYRTGGCDTWCENGECYSPNMSKIPIADVEKVKHGEWLMCLTDEPWQKGYHGRCSVCGAIYSYNISKMPKRCDNCDAKMDGGKK